MVPFLRTFIVTLLLSGVTLASPSPEVTTRIPITNAPGWFNLRISVPKDERNRVLCLQVQQVQNGSYYRNSCWAHEGVAAPLTTWKMVKELQAGRYLAAVVVVRSDETRQVSAPITLRVMGFGYESEPEL